jgi:hypothetical protein
LVASCRDWRKQIVGERQSGISFMPDWSPESRPLDRDVFAAVAAIGEVRQLGFYEPTLTDDGLAQLAGLRQVETLIAPGSPISDSSAPVLANYQELTWLELTDSQLTDAAVPHLLKLKKLEVLRIQGTRITDQGARQLAALSNLRDLSLGDSERNPMPISVACREELQRQLPGCGINGTFRAD